MKISEATQSPAVSTDLIPAYRRGQETTDKYSISVEGIRNAVIETPRSPAGSPSQVLLHHKIPSLAGVVEDESGNGNDGQLKEIPTAYMDGTLFSFPFAPEILQSRDQFSMSIFWKTRVTGLTNNVGVIGGHLSASTLPAMRVTSNGALQCYAEIGGTLENEATATGLITTGSIHHMAVTYDGSNMQLYIDGVTRASGAYAGSTNASSTNTRIGGGVNGSTTFNDGSFWDARIYDVGLSSGDVYKIANRQPVSAEPVAWWPACEQGGIVIHDVTASGNHITGTVGSALWQTETQDEFHYLSHYGGTAKHFNGTNGGNDEDTLWVPSRMDGSLDAEGNPVDVPAGPYMYLNRGTLDTSIAGGESAYAAPEQRTNPAFARILGDNKASRLVRYSGAIDGETLVSANEFSPSIHTISEDGVWSWFSDDRTLIQSDGSLLVGFVGATGDIKAAHYNPSTRVSTEFVLGDVTEADDHNSASFVVTDDDRVLSSYSRHNADHFTRFKKSTTPIVDSLSDFGSEATEDRGANASYASLLKLDNGEIWSWHRVNQAWGWAKSVDHGVNWTTSDQAYTSTNNPNCYSKFASVGNRIWIAANNAYPNGFDTSMFAFYIEDGFIYEPDGTVIATLGDPAFNLEDLQGTSAEVYAFTSSAVADINDGIQSGRAWVWDLKMQGDSPVIAFHLEVLVTPSPSPVDGSNVWRDDADRGYYYVARYNGGVKWELDFLAHAGFAIGPYSSSYMGGIAIGLDEDTYYFCSTSEDPTSRSSTAPAAIPNRSLYKAVKSPSGVWTYTEIIPKSYEGHGPFRPHVAISGTKQWLTFSTGPYSWWDGGYYRSAIQAIELS